MRGKKELYTQLIANCIPLVGYWFLHWNMFAIIYLYWAEGLITAFYGCSKIVIAIGPETNRQNPDLFFNRLISAIKYFVLRILLLLFYWIFIFAFIAHPGGVLSTDIARQNYMILFFLDHSFNSVLLVYMLSQLIIFIAGFIATGEYKNNPSSRYKVFFDSRTIVLHLVIVLGTFSYQFLQKFESYDNKLPALSYVLILLVVKSLSDIFQYKLSVSSGQNTGVIK